MKIKVFMLLGLGLMMLSGQVALAKDDAGTRSSHQSESHKQLELLGKIHSHNEVFDNYHLGGTSYEDLSK